MTTTLTRRGLLGLFGASGAAALMPQAAFALVEHAAASTNATAMMFPDTAAFLDSFVSAHKLAGTLAAIGIGDDTHYLGAGHITLGGAPVDADSLWRIYSMTKPITGMATMMLIEDGRLSLDQPLADILPAFARMQVQVTPDGSITDLKPAQRAITIRQLLTHTAGLGYGITQKGPIKDAYLAAGIIPGQISRMALPGLDRGTPAPSLAAFADALATMPLVYEPGTQWSYSVSMDLLGRVIEVVSGKDFGDFLTERLFGPLGMTSTFWQVPASEVHRLTTNYTPFNGALMPIDPAATSIYLDPPPFKTGGAGLVSSARDYDRFLLMLQNYGRIGTTRVMAEATARLAMSNLIDDSVERKGSLVDSQGFGAGGRVSLAGSPGGAGIYGWGGAAGTVAFVDPARRMRLGGFAQYMPPDSANFQGGLAPIVLGDLMKLRG